MQRRKVLQLFAASSMGAALGIGASSFKGAIADESGSSVWGYVGNTSPENWSNLSSTYKACQAGLQQSPIDLRGGIEAELAAVDIRYRPIPLTILNNGHTIQVDAVSGNSISLDGEEFELKQFHFHHPSEHTVDGEVFPMEVHFVHANGRGELAVLGVFLKEGTESSLLRPVWENMPYQKANARTISGVEVDIAGILPSDRAMFRYFGSLTTPPCSEIVKWVVFQEPMEASREQISEFKNLFPLNARPVQPLNRRFVLQST